MRDDLDAAWTLYQDVVAPAPVETGFVVASSLALWCIAYVADWAAFRLWVPFEATLPAGTLFLFTALLGADRGRGWAVGDLRRRDARLPARAPAGPPGRHQPLGGRPAARPGHRSLLTAGTALGAVAVVAGSVIGPSLPGADSPACSTPPTSTTATTPRVTISPLVDIRSRLVDQSNVEVFQVRATSRAYWRLTSLERFDGRIWSSSGSYGKADGDLPEAVDGRHRHGDHHADVQHQRRWPRSGCPAPTSRGAFDGDDLDVRYDEDSATLIVDGSVPTQRRARVPGDLGRSPRLTPEDLAGTGGDIPDDITERFTGLPDGFSPRVQQLALDLTAGATTPYERPGPSRTTCAPSPTTSPCRRGTAATTSSSSCSTPSAATASSSPAPSRRWPGPSGCRPGWRWGSPRARPTRPSPTCTACAASTPTPGPRCSSRAPAGWPSSRPRAAGMPGAEAYTGVPESQAAAGDPTTATTAHHRPRRTPAATVPASTARPDRDGEVERRSRRTGGRRRRLGRRPLRARALRRRPGRACHPRAVAGVLLLYAIGRAPRPLRCTDGAGGAGPPRPSSRSRWPGWSRSRRRRSSASTERPSDTYDERSPRARPTCCPTPTAPPRTLARAGRDGDLLRRGRRPDRCRAALARGRRDRRGWPAGRRPGRPAIGGGSTRGQSSRLAASPAPPAHRHITTGGHRRARTREPELVGAGEPR